MKKIRKRLKYLFITIAAVLAGILLFTAQTSIIINHSILSSDFHRQLFVKHNIYAHTQQVVSSSMKDFINNFKKSSPQNYDQFKSTFSLLETTLSPEMIRFNVDSIREGLFQYFKGEKIFLPDINLNPQGKAGKQASGDVPADSNAASQALTKITRINLSVILSYIDRNDIMDKIMIIKFIYYLLNALPMFSLLIFSLNTVFFLFFCNTFREGSRWLALAFFTSGVLGIAGGAVLLIYSYRVLPGMLVPITTSVPLESSVIISYSKDCVWHLSAFSLGMGTVSFLMALGSLYSPKLIQKLGSGKFPLKVSPKAFKGFRYTAFLLTFILCISLLGYQSLVFKKGFDSNDFLAIVDKLKNSNAVMQVISARDDAIYVLQVRLVDEKENKPVSNVTINIRGKSNILKKDFNETAATDETGSAKFSLDNGTFRLSVNSINFPVQYQLPSPFFFDLKKAGTTMITVNLNRAPELEKPKWGIAEIEILDDSNKPVPGIELFVEGVVSAPGYPDKINSNTNSEGIAVFKINEGAYKINFKRNTFPTQYILPSTLDISVSYNAVTRYTLRLAAVKDSPKTFLQKNVKR